ncbi:MAG: hypothetical protein ABI836_00665 [Gemmatimonadota bacterium]
MSPKIPSKPSVPRRVAEREVRLFARGVRHGKVRKEFWLDPAQLRAAQTELGAATEREAVELALDLVNFRRELLRGVAKLGKVRLSRID